MRPKKILIAVPMLKTVVADFTTSLIGAMQNTDGVPCLYAPVVDTLVWNARNKLMITAMEKGCDYIMWFDSDMTFENDTILKMIRHMEEGYDFVSGLYFSRVAPVRPVISKELIWERKENGDVLNNANLYWNYPKDEVFEIAASGFGCVMMKTEIILKAAEYFNESPFNPLPQMGEDYSCCWRLSQMGVKMYCDSSIKCGHVGYFTYTEDTYLKEMERYGRENSD